MGWQCGAPHLPVSPFGPALGCSAVLSPGHQKEQPECVEKGWVTGGGEYRAHVLSSAGFKHVPSTQAGAHLSNLLPENSLASTLCPDSLWSCPPPLDTGDRGTESHKLRLGPRWRQTEAPPHPFLIFPALMASLYQQFSA